MSDKTEFMMTRLKDKDGNYTGDIRTCEVRLSFPELFVAKAVEEGGKKKFSSAILFPKGADLSPLRDAIKSAIKDEWGDSPPKGLRVGVRDQGEKDFEGYEEGAFFLNASSERRPPLVNRRSQPINDEEDVYPGIYALVVIRPYAFKPKKGDKYGPGVGFGLQAIQIIKDGERLGGGFTDPNEVFETLPDLKEGQSADEIFGGGDTAGDDDMPF